MGVMNTQHGSARMLASAPPEELARVQIGGRSLRPIWSLYPGGRRLSLSLREVRGLAPALPATVDVDWICQEDQIVLGNAELHRALARAGIVRDGYEPLLSNHGTLILARLTAAELERLPEQVCEAGLPH